jgi:tetrahydromethanopterin S-methyltransferase subunit B
MNITEKIAKVLIPQEILEDFIVVDVQELVNEWIIELEEKSDRIPASLQGKDVVLDGFYDSIDLISGVMMEQVIYLRIRRRRWKERGSKKHEHNQYDYHFEGMKTTKRFAAFLKEVDRYKAG